MAETQSKDVENEIRTRIATGNISGALELLGEMFPHRFSAIFMFDDSLLRNAFFYDRENPEIKRADGAVPVEESYCVFVRESRDSFSVANAPTDERVVGHPKRDVFRSYCGVPILDEDDSLWGTICQFDPDPLNITDEQVALLERFAWMLKNLTPQAFGVRSSHRDA